jgi:hypothetical protein
MDEARALIERLPSSGLSIEELSRQRARWSFAQFAETRTGRRGLALEQTDDPERRAAFLDEGFAPLAEPRVAGCLEGHRGASQRSPGTPRPSLCGGQRQSQLADRNSALVALAAARRTEAPAELQASLRARAARERGPARTRCSKS